LADTWGELVQHLFEMGDHIHLPFLQRTQHRHQDTTGISWAAAKPTFIFMHAVIQRIA